MSPHRHKEEFNENWEAEIAEYDRACREREMVYEEHAMIIDGDMKDLSEEENLVLSSYLSGMTVAEIAEEASVEEDIVSGLLEIIKAKLSITD